MNATVNLLTSPPKTTALETRAEWRLRRLARRGREPWRSRSSPKSRSPTPSAKSRAGPHRLVSAARAAPAALTRGGKRPLETAGRGSILDKHMLTEALRRKV